MAVVRSGYLHSSAATPRVERGDQSRRLRVLPTPIRALEQHERPSRRRARDTVHPSRARRRRERSNARSRRRTRAASVRLNSRGRGDDDDERVATRLSRAFFAICESRDGVDDDDGVDDLASDSTHRVDGRRRRAARCGRTANRPRASVASDSNARGAWSCRGIHYGCFVVYEPTSVGCIATPGPTPTSLMSQHSSHTMKTLKTRTPKRHKFSTHLRARPPNTR